MSHTPQQRPYSSQSSAPYWNVSSLWNRNSAYSDRIRTRLFSAREARSGCLSLHETLSDTGEGHLEATPHEHLIAAFNSYLLFGYLAIAQENGALIEAIRIESSSDFKIEASFFKPALSGDHPLGSIHYTTLVKSTDPIPLLRGIHDKVRQSARNHFLPAMRLEAFSKLVIE